MQIDPRPSVPSGPCQQVIRLLMYITSMQNQHKMYTELNYIILHEIVCIHGSSALNNNIHKAKYWNRFPSLRVQSSYKISSLFIIYMIDLFVCYSSQGIGCLLWIQCMILMSWCKTTVITPLIKHWSYCSLSLRHHFIFYICNWCAVYDSMI